MIDLYCQLTECACAYKCVYDAYNVIMYAVSTVITGSRAADRKASHFKGLKLFSGQHYITVIMEAFETHCVPTATSEQEYYLAGRERRKEEMML